MVGYTFFYQIKNLPSPLKVANGLSLNYKERFFRVVIYIRNKRTFAAAIKRFP